MEACTHAVKENDLIKSLGAMVCMCSCIKQAERIITNLVSLQGIMSKMLQLMPAGVLNVGELALCIVVCCKSMCIVSLLLDVKMDWCNSKVNGTQLEPRVQYPQMVSCIMRYNHIQLNPRTKTIFT